MIRCKLPICIHMILAHGIDIQDVQVVSTLMQFGTKKTVESFLTDLQLNPAFVDSEVRITIKKSRSRYAIC